MIAAGQETKSARVFHCFAWFPDSTCIKTYFRAGKIDFYEV